MVFDNDDKPVGLQEWEYKPNKGKEIDLAFN